METNKPVAGDNVLKSVKHNSLTWNVYVIDLYSFHVSPDSIFSLFLRIASCSSCKMEVLLSVCSENNNSKDFAD